MKDNKGQLNVHFAQIVVNVTLGKGPVETTLGIMCSLSQVMRSQPILLLNLLLVEKTMMKIRIVETQTINVGVYAPSVGI